MSQSAQEPEVHSNWKAQENRRVEQNHDWPPCGSDLLIQQVCLLRLVTTQIWSKHWQS